MPSRPQVAVAVLFALLFTSSASCARELPLDTISLPPGFGIELYAAAEGARSLALGDDGLVFVGTRDTGAVYALEDSDRDGAAETVHVIASGLEQPNGVAVRDGDLYVAEISRILRWEDIASRLDDPGEPDVLDVSLPEEEWHGWKYIAFGPDGMLYVPVGAPCNVCDEPAPFSTILRMQPDGSDREVFARGIRNTVGFDWHPETGVLWFTNNGRDWMGDTRPPDSLHRAPQKGLDFGFPQCHAGIPDPEYNTGTDCSRFAPPALRLPAHVAPLGMTFITEDVLPPEYRSRVIIAEHGSWNRSTKVGYRLTMADIADGGALNYQVFAEGWLQDTDAWGRPVDVLELPDGSLLVSDDRAGAVYRISYSGE